MICRSMYTGRFLHCVWPHMYLQFTTGRRLQATHWAFVFGNWVLNLKMSFESWRSTKHFWAYCTLCTALCRRVCTGYFSAWFVRHKLHITVNTSHILTHPSWFWTVTMFVCYKLSDLTNTFIAYHYTKRKMVVSVVRGKTDVHVVNFSSHTSHV